MIHMKTLAIIFALAACTVGDNLEPDAGQPAEEDTGGCMGNLPLNRTASLGPDDPVPSALLNEIQDMIELGAHGPKFIVLGGESFSLRLGTGTEVDGHWTFSAVPAVLRCNLPLPAGATVTSLFTWASAGGAGTITSKFRRKNLFGTGGPPLVPGAASDIASDAKTGTYGASILIADPGTPYVVPAVTIGTHYSHWLEIQAGNTANTFEGAVIAFYLAP